LLFARPENVPAEWITEQTQIAQLPGFTEATVAALRAHVDLGGQREVLVDQLCHLPMPTLVVWGKRDRVFPYSQGKIAVSRLRQGFLELIPIAVTCPTSSDPSASRQFSANFSVDKHGSAMNDRFPYAGSTHIDH
jgi:pimeloyl-ACP methyl ester carboxylesterase